MTAQVSSTLFRPACKRKDLLQFANEERKEGYFNDIVIEVEDESIQANKMILSCYSNFFKKLFRSKMKEQYETSVKITGVDKKSAKSLIEYLYTGNIKINNENVIGLLSGADYMQLDEVKGLCFAFLDSALTVENCFLILKCCDLYRNNSINIKTLRFIDSHFSEIIKDDNFKKLSKADLISCISNLNRNLINEIAICDGIITWIKADEEKRQSQIIDLFQLINFRKLPFKFLAKLALEEKLFEENHHCSKLVMKALARCVIEMPIQSLQKPFKMYGLISIPNNTMKLVGFDENFQRIESNYPDLPFLYRHSKIFKVQNFVFCASDYKVWRINVTEDKEWEEVCQLNMSRLCYPRYKSVFVIHNDCLIEFNCFGDVSYIKLPLNESGDFQLGEWKSFTNSNQNIHFRPGCASVSCDRYLYTLGGCDYDGNIKNIYSSTNYLLGFTQVWEIGASMNCPRESFAAVSYNGFIYVCGGKSNIDMTLKSSEKFNPFGNYWVYIRSMNFERCHHKTCAVDGKIFVFGGYNDNGEEVMEVECYDISRDEWNIVGYLEDDQDCNLFSITA